MIKGTSEELNKIVGTHKCPEHDNPLSAAWHQGENSMVIRCGAGHFPEEVVRVKSLTQLYKEGVELPEPMKSNVEKGLRKRQAAGIPTALPFELQGIPAADLGTGEVLSLQARQLLVEYARRYGLDAARSHVVIYQGRPYIGLDGYLFKAHLSNRPYSLRSRPLNADERLSMQLATGDHGWISECIFADTNQVFTGLGIVTHEEITEPSKRDPHRLRAPVAAAHPWQMAQKRSEWQALRRGFPIGVEADEDTERQPMAAPAGSITHSAPAPPPAKESLPAAAPPPDPSQVKKDIEELWPE